MLDKNDKKTISLIVIEALDTLVIPRLENIDKDIGGLKKDVSELKEDVSGLQDTTYRIEMKLDAEVKRHDTLSTKIVQIDKRVLKLEPKRA